MLTRVSIATFLIIAASANLRAQGNDMSNTPTKKVDPVSRTETGRFINTDAPTVAKTELAIDASPAAVWAVLTNISEWTRWMPEIASARLDGPLAVNSTIYWEPFGQKVASRIVAIEPERKLIWNGTDGAVHAWELIPIANGTLHRKSESIETWKAVEGTPDKSSMLAQLLTEWNRRLAEQSVQRGGKPDIKSLR